MPTLFQKIQLAWRGWNRRREEKNREFLAKNVRASGGQPSAAVRPAEAAVLNIDVEALVIAHLDASQRTTYYLDTQSGDVIESNVALDGARYKPVPAASHEDDRLAFLATLESTAHLQAAETFREHLAEDRKLERAWFNFRNDRAIAAIRNWLKNETPR